MRFGVDFCDALLRAKRSTHVVLLWHRITHAAWDRFVLFALIANEVGGTMEVRVAVTLTNSKGKVGIPFLESDKTCEARNIASSTCIAIIFSRYAVTVATRHSLIALAFEASETICALCVSGTGSLAQAKREFFLIFSEVEELDRRTSSSNIDRLRGCSCGCRRRWRNGR